MWLEIKLLTRLQIIRHCEKLERENKTLKDKIEFLTNCLDDRDKSIAIFQEEKKTNLVWWIVAILVLVVLRWFGIAFLNR